FPTRRSSDLDLRAAARAGGADARADGQRVERPELVTHEGVARVGAARDGGECEARVEFGGQVFQRVDGEVDLAGGEGFFDLLDEDAFGEGGFSGRLLKAVAGGADDLDGDLVAEGGELLGDVVGLPECELGAAGAYTDRFGHSPPPPPRKTQDLDSR